MLYSFVFVAVLLVQIFTRAQDYWMPIGCLIFLFVVYVVVIVIGSRLSAKAGRLLQKMKRDNVHNNAMCGYIGNLGMSIQNGKDIRLYQMEDFLMELFDKTLICLLYTSSGGTEINLSLR